MQEDPFESVYSFVERTYMRMQAGDILIHCMEESSPLPIQQMVENLVLGGPRSLTALQEIQTETEQRKLQVRDDLRQLLKDLEGSLKSYGVSLDDTANIEAVIGLSQVSFLALLRTQEIHDHETQKACLQIIKDCRDLFATLSSRYLLLQDIESYLQDWIWALVVQALHQKTWSQDSNTQSLTH
jgi:hypothetical protein